MFEAVNSTLSNAPLIRAQAEQASAARSFAANPEKVQEAPQAPYVSPYIYMDVNYNKAVLQIRDSDTGDVVRQIPTEPALEAARRFVESKPTQRAEAQPIVVETPDTARIAAPQQTPEASSAAFGAFAKQVATIQSVTSGPSIGTNVSTVV
jgi:hypothetical protein